MGRWRLPGPDLNDQSGSAEGQDITCKRTEFKGGVDELQKKKNKSKSSERAKVEHVFRILKNILGFDKIRYRDIAKNHNRLCANFALVKLCLHRRRPCDAANTGKSPSNYWKTSQYHQNTAGVCESATYAEVL